MFVLIPAGSFTPLDHCGVTKRKMDTYELLNSGLYWPYFNLWPCVHSSLYLSVPAPWPLRISCSSVHILYKLIVVWDTFTIIAIWQQPRVSLHLFRTYLDLLGQVKLDFACLNYLILVVFNKYVWHTLVLHQGCSRVSLPSSLACQTQVLGFPHLQCHDNKTFISLEF